MAQVTIRINGFAYVVGCEDGQESHLEAMAAQVDQRVDELKTQIGQSGETQLLVMLSLTMADELHDLKQEFASMRKQLNRAEAGTTGTDPRLGRRLAKLAQRAEDIASGLEAP
jgi:cell division protein ZapA